MRICDKCGWTNQNTLDKCPNCLTPMPEPARPTRAVFTSTDYAHEWQITVKADALHGAMDAVWQCWKAWQEGYEPIGGSCPARMGNRMDYDVKKTKRPAPQSVRSSATGGNDA